MPRQAIFIANSRCQVRVPGIGNHDMPRDSRTKLQEVGYQRSKFNWYQLAADYFKLRDPFAFPADGGVPFSCYDGTEPGCDGRTQCDPGVDNSCPGLDERGMARMYSLSTTGDRGGGVHRPAPRGQLNRGPSWPLLRPAPRGSPSVGRAARVCGADACVPCPAPAQRCSSSGGRA